MFTFIKKDLSFLLRSFKACQAKSESDRKVMFHINKTLKILNLIGFIQISAWNVNIRSRR